MAERDTIAEFERMAESSYSAMYEARPHNVKDHYEDAQLYFSRAIEAAQQAGLVDEVGRLVRRRDHVESVYNSQFRGVVGSRSCTARNLPWPCTRTARP